MYSKRDLIVGDEVVPKVVDGRVPANLRPIRQRVTDVYGIGEGLTVKTNDVRVFVSASLFKLDSEISEKERRELCYLEESRLGCLAAGRSAEDMAKEVYSQIGRRGPSFGLGEARLSRDVSELNRIRNRVSRTLYEAQLAAARLSESLSAIDADISELQESISMVYGVDEIVK